MNPTTAMPPCFFSCDWGTSTFRLRLVDADSLKVLAEHQNDQGVKVLCGTLPQNHGAERRAQLFHDYLAGQVLALAQNGPESCLSRDCPVVVSGMASSTVGWRELTYAKVPFPLNGSGAVTHPLPLRVDATLEMSALLVSGVASAKPGEAHLDVMRGEETELMGVMGWPSCQNLRQECLVILPGTHSKHVIVDQGVVTGFRTYMTGELFDVLTRHSLLRWTTQTDSEIEWDRESFGAGVLACRNAGLSGLLFQARSRALLGQHKAGANRDYLSGVLIGSEWMDAIRQAGDRRMLLAAAAPPLRARYGYAAEMLQLGSNLQMADARHLEAAVPAAHRALLEQRFAGRMATSHGM